MSDRNDRWIDVSGIAVHVTRKKVKGLRMHVVGPDAHVELSLPMRASLNEAVKFVESKASWVRRQQGLMQQSTMARADAASPQQKQEWKEVVSALTPVLVETWEPILGVKAGKLVYRNMTSRWGSCQPETGRICINTRLALYPPKCLEYVVVHELCHLIERGHGPRFYALMDANLPDWKERRACLR